MEVMYFPVNVMRVGEPREMPLLVVRGCCLIVDVEGRGEGELSRSSEPARVEGRGVVGASSVSSSAGVTRDRPRVDRLDMMVEGTF